MAKLKVVHKWVGLGRVHAEFHVNSGSGWVGSRKLDPRPTLVHMWVFRPWFRGSVRTPKWSDLVQIKIKMFVDGPCIGRCMLKVERS